MKGGDSPVLCAESASDSIPSWLCTCEHTRAPKPSSAHTVATEQLSGLCFAHIFERTSLSAHEALLHGCCWSWRNAPCSVKPNWGEPEAQGACRPPLLQRAWRALRFLPRLPSVALSAKASFAPPRSGNATCISCIGPGSAACAVLVPARRRSCCITV